MNDKWRTHLVNVAGDEAGMLDREWLLTNGTGAYAMGTLAGSNTRRYHGLLVAASDPPVGRVVAINQVFEQLHVTGPTGRQHVEFTTCLFRGDDGAEMANPGGWSLLRRFDRGTSVAWAYQWGSVQFIRELFLHQDEQAATLRYRVAGLAQDQSATLCLHPMLILRDFHALLRQSDAGTFTLHRRTADAVTVQRRDVAATFRCVGAAFHEHADWWYGVHYPVEAERGMEHGEDLYLPGYFESPIAAGTVNEVLLTAALGEVAAEPRADTDAREAHLAPIVQAIAPRLGQSADLALPLALAADDFVVRRRVGAVELSSILAGYPWFADWGRDTFIALPGLLLCTGRFDEARATLKAFASVLRNGLVPNRFDDYDASAGAAHYNTVDASLWFIHAGLAYMDATEDAPSWDQWLRDAITQVIDAYIRGTDNDIRMAGDGMITAGSERTQLTWMDAKCNGVIFTPRQGKAVEINALWYHALEGMADRLAAADRRTAEHYRKLAGRIRRGFLKVFWDDELGYCRDHVWIGDDGNEHADRSLRPNQVLVASLPHSPLPQTKQRQLLKALRDRLLTPYGLRTLPVGDRHYHGQYRGGPFDRDKAYHQGTVWPWLMGAYAEGVLRAGRFSDESRQEARRAVQPLVDFMMHKGLGQLYEIHEGDEPHRPVGCIAQAWSVGELLRALCLIETGKA